MLRTLAFLAGLCAVYSWWIEPSRLTITRHEISDLDQPLANPIHVLLLTDWHLGRWSRPRVLSAKISRLQRLHQRYPFDLILLGGDFIDDDPRRLPQMIPALAELGRFEIPMFAVLGNHDYTSFDGDVTPLVKRLQAQGVTVLRNSAAVITIGGQRLCVVGLDDLQESQSYYTAAEYRRPAQYRQAAEKMDWYAQFDDTEPDTPRLLLAHNPDAVYLPGRKPLAVLAGHTHGGQIMLLDWVSRPLHRWLHWSLPPGSIITWAGRKIVNGRILIVSRGLEGAALPLRLLRPPEAVILTLR